MNTNAKILITGTTGMVGAAVARLLAARGFNNLLTPRRAELDLLRADQVNAYFAEHRPEHVLAIAAKVGGISANMADPVGFLTQNAKMTLNVMESIAEHGCGKSLFLGSSCIYPREAPQPIRESSLLTGPYEPTNEGYALAKTMGIRLAQALWKEGRARIILPMPCNVYGTGDYFDFEKAHVLSALVRRFIDAREECRETLTLWGTGRARREFIHVDDLARAILFLMERYDEPEIINVGPGTDLTIAELANAIADAAGFKGKIAWDHNRPDGMPRKCLEVSRLTALGFVTEVSLEQGIRRTIAEYEAINESSAPL